MQTLLKYSSILLLSTSAMMLSPELFAQQGLTANAKLLNATIFRQGATLKHSASVTLPTGVSDVTIYNVANSIDEESIKMNIPENITILSISSATRLNNDDSQKSANYQRINTELKAVLESQKTIADKIEAERISLDILKSNQSIKGQNASLLPAEVAKMITYQKQAYLEAKTNISTLEAEKKKIDLEVNGLQYQLNGLQEGSASSSGVLILSVMNNKPATYNFEIEYLTNTATWSSTYDIRSNGVNQPVKFVQNAAVVQTSGINWNNVNLKLSTGNPYTNSTIPELYTWNIPPTPVYTNAAVYKNKSMSTRSMSSASSAEVSMDKLQESSISNYVQLEENQLNVVYDISLPYTIASTGKPYNVALKDYSYNAEYTYYAVPKFAPNAYLKANVLEFKKDNLTPGSANIFFENYMIGKTYVNPQAASDTLNLGLGIDNNIVVDRKKVDKMTETSFIGSNKRYNVGYEIKVKNNKKQAIEITIEDQIPVSTEDKVSVDLGNTDNATLDKVTGKLTWKLKIPAGQSQSIKYNYTVKAPKDIQLQL